LPAFTQYQEDVVEAVIKHGSYEEAARMLGKSQGTIRKVFYKVRIKDEDAIQTHAQVNQWRKRLGPHKKYLNL
jgi:DNA-directed RNA polymerase specialized sigma24 family protein